MDAAKNAVKDFMHKDGKHTTNVHETMAPTVTHETQHRHDHENVTTAIDKEVHQDHYHHTVQPIKDKEVLPEQHSHRMAGVEHRKFEHGNDQDVQSRLESERAKFHDKTIEGETRQTSTAAPTIAGEHVHHHVHEHIQPILQKEKIQQNVLHTTVPIHEVHHNESRHHATNALPAISLADFKKQGGSLAGRDERSDFFEGEPRNIGHNTHATDRPEDESSNFRKTGHTGLHSGTSTTGSSGLTGSTTGAHHHHGSAGTGLTGSNTTTGTTSGVTGHDSTRSGGITGGQLGNQGTHGRTDSAGVGQETTTASKPSLLSRLNPLKDSDGDGKKGIMD